MKRCWFALSFICLAGLVSGCCAQQAHGRFTTQEGAYEISDFHFHVAGVDDLHRLLTDERSGKACAVDLIRGTQLLRRAVTPQPRFP